MRTALIRFVVAIGLAVGAWFSWAEARLAGRMADTRERIATLQFSDVAEADEEVAWPDLLLGGDRLKDEARVAAATVDYWMGRYGAVTPDTGGAESDGQVLLTAANASFRASQRDAGTGMSAVQQLDGVLNSYASVLKAAPDQRDAAYNYEFVARLRDQVARAKGKTSKPASPPVVAASAGDLPSGPTIHGRPGAPPPEAKMEDLQMIAPMEYGDREAQPEATPGGKRERKG